MKALKSISYIILFFFIILIAACSSIEDPEFLDVERIELVEDKTDELVIASDISIYNPNWFSISADDITFNLYIDTFYIGKGDIIDDLLLPKKDTAIISSLLIIQKNCLDSSVKLSDSISINILGSSAIPYISKRFYFNFDYKLYINNFITFFADKFIQEDDIQIKEVRINKIDLANIYLEVTFLLDNKSEMEYTINKLDVEVYKSNKYKNLIGNSKIDESFTILADTVNEFKTRVQVSTLMMGSAIFSNSLSNKNSFFIKVNSKVEYNNIEVPFTIQRRVDYNPLTLEIELK